MAYGRIATFDALREAAFGSVIAGYTAMGAAMRDNVRILMIYNTTDTDIYISFDGATDHLRIPSHGGETYDFTANKVRDDGLFLPIGTIVYQKRTGGAPTGGNIWVQVTYGTGGV
jgi:hypothetical protein